MSNGHSTTMNNDQWRAHVQAITADLAQRAGTVAPVVRLRPVKSLAVRRTRQAPGWAVLVPREQVSDAQLRGSLAHELQHVKFEDVGRLNSRAGVALIGLCLIALLWGATLLTVAARAFPLSPVSVLVTILSATALMMTTMVATLKMLVRRDDGLTQPVVELRNDLAAADLVGIADATASLRAYRTAELRHPWRTRLNIESLRTHPQTQTRIDAIEARDSGVSPLTAAQQRLTKPAARQ